MFSKTKNTQVGAADENRTADGKPAVDAPGIANADTAAAADKAAADRAQDNAGGEDTKEGGIERDASAQVVIPAEHSATNGAETVSPSDIKTADEVKPFDPAAHQAKADAEAETVDGGDKAA